MSKNKNRNYVNYYAKSTYEKENDYKSEAIVRYDKDEQPIDISEESEVSEVIPPSGDGIEASIVEPKISPEEKSEIPEMPDHAELITNIYIRETPYGDKVPKDELDRIISSKVIKDMAGWAIVPKGTKIQIYDMFVHEDGSIWFNTRFGYLMAKSKTGDKFIE